MKIRIQGNTLRLRLKQQEISALASGQPVKETVDFPLGDQLQYAVSPTQDHDEISAIFREGKISVEIPDQFLDGWELDDRVGLYREIETEEHTFSIAVEKDFKCLHKRPNEDESDNYPHPMQDG